MGLGVLLVLRLLLLSALLLRLLLRPLLRMLLLLLLWLPTLLPLCLLRLLRLRDRGGHLHPRSPHVAASVRSAVPPTHIAVAKWTQVRRHRWCRSGVVLSQPGSSTIESEQESVLRT